MTRSLRSLLVLALGLVTACAQLGPRTVPMARLHYSEALARSADEQLLRNIVRLRYRDTPVFLEVGSIVTSFHWNRSGGVFAAFETDDLDSAGVSLNAGVSITEAPTVTYSPVQGDAFFHRLLGPISPENLLIFSQNGWSIERLLRCCVQRLNRLSNAIPAAGPTPDYVPDFADFQAAARLLRSLQMKGLLRLELGENRGEEGEGKAVQKSRTPYLILDVPAEHALAEDAAKLRQLLGLDPQLSRFQVTPGLEIGQSNELAMSGRSLLSVLFFLSQGVEIPSEHEKLVTVTLNGEEKFDWKAVVGDLLRVRTSPSEPLGAAVRVRHRGHWFYLADDDLNSRTTFGLLGYLYALKAGSGELKEPLLALGIR